MKSQRYIRHASWLVGALLIAMLSWVPAYAQETCQAVVGDGIQEQTLFAGQTINAGTVTLEVLESDMIVTYRTIDGWELTEAHLWVGDSLNDLPQTRRGNPKIGRFPYNSGDITGATEFSFIVPLAELEFSCPGDDSNFFAAAHAALRRPDGSGGFQTETGWADGERIVPRGNWATFFEFTLSCVCNDGGDGEDMFCESAYAFGETELDDIPDLTNGGTITDHFGWQIGPVGVGTFAFSDLFAGAGNNDISVAEQVGSIIYDYHTSRAACEVTVVYDTTFSTSALAPWFLRETHVYVGTEQVQTGAPGQFGNSHEELGDVAFDFYNIPVAPAADGSCPPIFVVAHAQVCYMPDDDDDDDGGGAGGGSSGGEGGTGGEGEIIPEEPAATDTPAPGNGHGRGNGRNR